MWDILLHIQGLLPTRVRFLHSWAVSVRVHLRYIQRTTLWSVLPTSRRGSDCVCLKLGHSNAPVLRDRNLSGTGSWVLSGQSGARHPLSPVIRLGLRNPRKKERKFETGPVVIWWKRIFSGGKKCWKPVQLGKFSTRFHKSRRFPADFPSNDFENPTSAPLIALVVTITPLPLLYHVRTFYIARYTSCTTYSRVSGSRNHGFWPSQRVSKHTLMKSATQPASVVSINH